MQIMGLGVRLVLILICSSGLFIAGTLIFAKGFLLKRVVINQNSSCHVDFALHENHNKGGGCWLHSSYKKAIFIIIDALRFDFVAYDDKHNENSSSFMYKNKLIIINKLLTKKPHNSRLYKFIADPPTTTLQRLKGLTTGSLPTFVDAGSNFASSEITEDNFIDQLVKKKKRIKFMGDDTWVGLFPNRFQQSFPFPSFNVKDLHTVDNGIIKHLIPEIKRTDWDVMIAHFLGVDHCGHRFGPNHVAMSEKLSQMNEVLSSVINELDTDTILFVMGDHGMTRTGDHGGDSPDEVEAALFVYSPSRITATHNSKEYKTISQTDLVPTVSLLLGLPIPFSNIGMVVTDLFTHCPWWETEGSPAKQVYHSLKALRLNAQQISHYIQAYSKQSSEFPQKKFTVLQAMLNKAEDDSQKLATALVTSHPNDAGVVGKLKELESLYSDYIREIRVMCQNIWAKFDIGAMLLGILIIIIANLFCIYLLNIPLKESLPKGVYVGTITSYLLVAYCVYQVLFMAEDVGSVLSLFMLVIDIVVILAIIIGMVANKPNNGQKPEIHQEVAVCSDFTMSYIASLAALLQFAGYFSNSYVVHEDSVTAFLCHSLLMLQFYFVARQEARSTEDDISKRRKSPGRLSLNKALTNPISLMFFVSMLCSICIRLTASFRSCREEQWTCVPSDFLMSLASLTDNANGFKNFRYFLSVCCLICTVIAVRTWLAYKGNLTGLSPSVLIFRYGTPLAAVCIALHWAVQGLPQKILDSLSSWQQVILPRIAYAVIISSLIILLIKPLMIYVVSQSDTSIPTPRSEGQVIPALFKQMKTNWKKYFTNDIQAQERPPMVYGLGTVFSASVLYCVLMVSLLVMLLLGDGPSPSIILALITVYLFLEVHSVHVLQVYKETECRPVPWMSLVSWCLLMSHFFYATGHQASIPSIRFEAAFTGFQDDFESKIVPGILIYLNTFASQVLFTVASPLLLLWPCISGNLIKLRSKAGKTTASEKGDFSFFENPVQFKILLFKVCIGMFLFTGIQLFGSVCAAALHRRHLMVWKIFAPRFVFQAAASLVVFILGPVMYLIMMRISLALEGWVTQLEKVK